jgi:hypothetical protein
MSLFQLPLLPYSSTISFLGFYWYAGLEVDVNAGKRRLLVLGPFLLKKTTYRALRRTIIPNKCVLHKFPNMLCNNVLYNMCWSTLRAFVLIWSVYLVVKWNAYPLKVTSVFLF